jgi:H+/Cl- antiporter ClcA
MAAKLPGFSLTPAVGVGLAAAMAAVLRLPLGAIVLATLLTANAGVGATPLIVVGAVVAYLTSVLLYAPPEADTASEPDTQAAEGPSPVAAQGA